MTFDQWGQPGEWLGFATRDGEIDGRRCRIVIPPNPRAGRLWIWKPEFLDCFFSVDVAMLNHGYYWVYLDVTDHFGCPKAISHGDVLYRTLTTEWGFHPKTAFAALSRAGLFAYNWSIRYPERVRAIYADNPVADFKSWPAGWGSGPGSPENWQKCLEIYGLSESEAREYPGNPVDRLQAIADAKIPVLQVVGDADEVVPVEENAYRVREFLQAQGSPYREIVTPGGLHHPHGLPDPTPIIEFLIGGDSNP